jgi:diguanylate cyclase (GGDEF)-like protein/PAS domain S-box-containing protein
MPMPTPAARFSGYLAGFHLLPAIPWLVLGIGLAISLALWRDADLDHHEKLRLAFDGKIAKLISGIDARVNAHDQILRGVTGLFAASKEVDRNEFRDYVTALRVGDLYPGIQGIGFSRFIPGWELTPHIEALRQEGFPEYTVRPVGEREVYSAIIYLEPFDWRNQRALGFDMFSEPVRQQAMVRARDSGRAALSGKVTLVQETDKDVQPGTLLYVPVYQGGETDSDSIEQRRQRLLGWAYSPIRMRDMLGSILEHDFPELAGLIGIAVYDGEVSAPENLLFHSVDREMPDRYLSSRSAVEVAGRQWLIEAYTLPGFAATADANRAGSLLGLGAAFSVLLAFISWLFARHHQQITNAIGEVGRANRALENSRNELQAIYDTSSVAIFQIDHHRIITHANQRMAEIFNTQLNDLIGKPYTHLLGAPQRETGAQILDAALTAGDGSIELESQHQRADGSLFLAHLSGRPLVDYRGQPLGMVGVITDITEQRRAEAELRIAAVAFESNEGIVVTDAEGVAVRINEAFSQLTGYSAQEVVGRKLNLLHSGRHNAEFYRGMWQEILDKGFWQGEVWNRHKSGQVYPQWETITAVKDASGKTTHYVGSAFDISQRIAVDAEMRNLAFYDPLTGLANRRLLTDRLQHAFSKSSRSKYLGALIYLDLDRFKELNDRLGHAEGDHLLELVADRLSNNVREGDTVARLGGDEFVVLLEDLDSEPEAATQLAMSIAEKLRLALNAPYVLRGRMPDDWQCTPSIGVAMFSDHRETMEAVLKRADQALYAAKHGGRNTVRLDETGFSGQPATG